MKKLLGGLWRGKSPWLTYILLIVGMMVPNLVLTISPYLSFVGKVVNLLMPLGLWMVLFACCRKSGKAYFCLLFFALLNAVQLVILTIFSGSVIAVDTLLNLLASDSDEAGELLSGLLLPIVLVLVLYISLGVLSYRSIRSSEGLRLAQRRRLILWGSGSFLLSLPFALYAGKTEPTYYVRNEVYPLNVLYNMYLAGEKLSEVAHYYETSKAFDYHARRSQSVSGPEVYVLVIGETSRAANWSLYGYGRDTNPRLAARGSELVVYRDVVTQSNTTYRSVPILLSPADADHADDLPRVKGVVTAMKQAGFHTVYISNQTENRSFIDFLAHEADEFHPLRQELVGHGAIYDDAMLPYLERALGSGHQRLFIVLHSYGSHFAYWDRYPASDRYFTNDVASSASYWERDKLMHAYDNAIRYTDKFLSSVIDILSKRQVISGMLYISDHGEDIFDDDRRRILHSSPSLSYYQLHVPCVLWLSEQWRQMYPREAETAHANADKPLTSNVVFHSMLGLAHVETPYKRDSLSLLSPRLDVGERAYLNDRYERISLQHLGLTELDMAQWQAHRLAPLPSDR